MCYRCQQDGHYARDCLHTTYQKPTEKKMEKLQALLRSMTTTEQTEFKKHALEMTTQTKMGKMQAHLQMMTTTEQAQFKREVTPSVKQIFIKALLKGRSSPHANQPTTTNHASIKRAKFRDHVLNDETVPKSKAPTTLLPPC